MTAGKWLKAAAVLALVLASGVAQAQTKTLRYANAADVETMDPAGRFEIFTLSFLHAIYEPLIRYDRDLKLEPALATKWVQVDPLTWRFTLRDNVKFQDGSPFSADDVAFTVTRAKSEGSAMIPTLSNVKEAVAVDPKTVEFRLVKPHPTLLYDLAYVLIMSKSWAEANDSVKPSNLRAALLVPANMKAMGTGPYKLVKRVAGTVTELEPNAGWWDKPAKPLPRIEFHPVPVSATRVAALLSGEMDVIDPLPLQDAARIKADPRFAVVQRPEMRTLFLGMDQMRDELLESDVKGKNPFKDPRVRRALYQGIDTEAIKRTVMNGAAVPTGSMIAPNVIGYDASMETRLPYNVEAAKKLLIEAGYPNGFSTGMDCPNDRWVNDERVCLSIATMLARVGIRVNLNVQNRTQFLNKILKQETSLYILGWTPGNNDAFDILKPILIPRAGGEGFFNLGGYRNDQVIALAKQVEIETDTAKRNAAIKQALKLHADDIGHIPLYRQYVTWGVRKGIDIVQRADGVLPLWQVHIQ